MAEDVTITLKADTSQYVKGINDAQKATQKLYETVDKGTKREKGLIEDLEDAIKDLSEARKKAYTVEDIEKYNKKLAEAKKDLQEYENAGVKANTNIEKSGNNLLKSVGKWALGFATITTAVMAFKKIIESTDKLSDKFARTLNGWKEGFNAMARAVANNDFKTFFQDVKNAVAEGQRFADTQEAIDDASRAARIEIAKNNTELLNLRIAQQNANLSKEEQIKLGQQAMDILKRNSALELQIAEQTLENDITNAAKRAKTTKEIVKAYLEQDEALLKNIALGERYNELQTQLANTVTVINQGTTSSTIVDKEAQKAIQAKIDALAPEAKLYSELAKNITNVIDTQKDKLTSDYEAIEAAKQAAKNLRVESALNADLADQNKKTDTDTVKSKEEYYNKLKQLQANYDKAVIESLSGEAKLEAVRDYELKQIKLFQSELEALGELTPEMKQQLQYLAEQVHKEFAAAMIKYGTLSSSEKEAVSQAIVSNLPTLESIQKSYIKTLPGDEFDFSLADKLGLGEQDIEDIKEALGDAFDEISNALDDYYSKEFENAEKHRELLDQRVSETQQALDDEIALYEAGYASNVEAKQKELAELQKARDEALKAEEQAQKKQLILESALQAAKLASAVANLFSKETAKLGIGGLISAGIGVAAMLVSFAASVAKIKSATTAYQLAEGGSGSDTGIITGKRHSEGGERFLDHVEVERGEQWGVLSRPASEKYGKVFHDMVSSFNKDQMPSFMPVTNQVRVENSGPNARLDKVNGSIKKLNDTIVKQVQISNIGGKKVIRNGNKVRIVG